MKVRPCCRHVIVLRKPIHNYNSAFQTDIKQTNIMLDPINNKPFPDKKARATLLTI